MEVSIPDLRPNLSRQALKKQRGFLRIVSRVARDDWLRRTKEESLCKFLVIAHHFLSPGLEVREHAGERLGFAGKDVVKVNSRAARVLLGSLLRRWAGRGGISTLDVHQPTTNAHRSLNNPADLQAAHSTSLRSCKDDIRSTCAPRGCIIQSNYMTWQFVRPIVDLKWYNKLEIRRLGDQHHRTKNKVYFSPPVLSIMCRTDE
jgi:hypothetical protein